MTSLFHRSAAQSPPRSRPRWPRSHGVRHCVVPSRGPVVIQPPTTGPAMPSGPLRTTRHAYRAWKRPAPHTMSPVSFFFLLSFFSSVSRSPYPVRPSSPLLAFNHHGDRDLSSSRSHPAAMHTVSGALAASGSQHRATPIPT